LETSLVQSATPLMRVYGLGNITGYINKVSSFNSGSKEEEVSSVFHEHSADLCTNKQTYNSTSSGEKITYCCKVYVYEYVLTYKYVQTVFHILL
jgi:hypothetical protein